MKLFLFFIFALFVFRSIAQPSQTQQTQQNNNPKKKVSYWDQIVHNIEIQHQGKPKSKNLNDYGLLNIEKNEYNHIKAYLLMKRKAKKKSQEYLNCINKISNASFSTDNIEKCIGKDYKYIKYDFDYQKKLVNAQVARQLRKIIFEECYKKAGIDLAQSQSCDLFQNDTLDMLWQGINFYKLLLDNEQKYVALIATMDLHVYENLIFQIKRVYDEYDTLIDGLTQQKEQVVFTIKTHIDNRSDEIVKNAEMNSLAPKPLIYTHHIEIRESMNGPLTTEQQIAQQSQRIKDTYAIPDTIEDTEPLDYGKESLAHDKQEQIRKQNMYLNSIINDYPPKLVQDKVRRQFGDKYIPMFPNETKK